MDDAADTWFDAPAPALARLRRDAEARGFAWESHALGDALALDAAVWPGDPACGTLVVTGGVHGVEAPLGVAACLSLLNDVPRPPGRVVLVPVVNPAGWRDGRRVDAGNTDLNRHFLLPGEEYRGAPAFYAEVDRVLNPQSPPPVIDDFLVRTAAATLRHGWRSLKDAIAGGQYEFPRGLFFGGRGPSRVARVLAEQWPRWAGGGRVTHLDFHTGLGRWASYKLLLDPGESAARAAHLGPAEVSASEGVSYSARGTLGPWARRHGGGDYLYACAEFGTYPGLTMIRGLRRENRAHHFAPGGRADVAAKAHLRELFAPKSRAWRRRALAEARGLVGRAAAAI